MPVLFCPRCGVPIDDDSASACHSCGALLGVRASERPTLLDQPAVMPAQVAGAFELGRPGTRLLIGRDHADIILASPQVSRRHAVVEHLPSGIVLRDLGSTNGTFVNGRPIHEYTLAAGDTIRIGAFKLAFDGARLEQRQWRGAARLDALDVRRAVTHGGKTRAILRGISFTVLPGEFVALVGPSGAGKTTLLSILSGQTAPSHGHVLINGDDLAVHAAAERANIGVVPQDDTLHGRLPAERALRYSAALRLPTDSGPAEIERSVAAALADVGMRGVGARPIDTLSGGQRKRISIAAELLADPTLFFLDEPAAGLDPGLERRLMQTLRNLADGGRTVVLVTHATANMTLCDQVAFLAHGRLVYFGPPGHAPAFFGLPDGDFAGIYNLLDGLADRRHPAVLAFARRYLADELRAVLEARPAGARGPSLAELWERRYRASALYGQYVRGRLGVMPPGDTASLPTRSNPSQPHAFGRQLALLVRRYADLMTLDRRNLALLLAQAPVIGLLIALVARPDALVGSGAYANEAKKVLFMLATVAVWFGTINAAREIAKETPVLQRERRAGVRLAPYLLSKLAVLAMLVVIQSLALIGCVALRVTLPVQGIVLPFAVELLLTTTLTGMAGIALGLAISAAAGTADRATSLVPLALVPQILFAGLIFNLGSGITLQRVLSWLTLSRWAMDAYGASANLNALQPAPGLLRPATPPPEYLATPEHLVGRWLILVAWIAAGMLASALIIRWRERRAGQ